MISATVSSSNKATYEELQSELDFYMNLEKNNAKTIENRKKLIEDRDAKIGRLEIDNKNLERKLYDCKQMAQFSKDLQLFHDVQTHWDAEEQRLKRIVISQAEEIRNIKKLNEELEISLKNEEEMNESWQDRLKKQQQVWTWENKNLRQECERNKTQLENFEKDHVAKLHQKCDLIEKEMEIVEKSNNDKLFSLRLKFHTEIDRLEDTIRTLNVIICTMDGTVIEQQQKISDLENEVRLHSPKRYTKSKIRGVENYPKDLLDTFSKQKTEQDTVPAFDDEVFHKEFAKRMTCKICVSDVERLRCSQCLKGICRGCHEKVENCPHCRNEKKNFQAIVMSRI